MYKGKAARIIKDAQVGDTIRLIRKEGVIEGILMPRTELADENHIVLKLDNGYNIGISVDRIKNLEILKRYKTPLSAGKSALKKNPSLPTIAILGTGGTIASKIDYKTGAVAPAFSAAELHQAIPELSKIANIRTKMLFNILSENMSPDHWRIIAKEAAYQLNKGVDGVVIAHGTDTMGYTGAALSFMLTSLSKPVVLVGSQRSSDRPSSDSATNLLAAARVAVSNASGVFVVMHGSISDDYCLVHRATRVRKMHSSRRDAFRSVNVLAVGKVNDEVEYTGEVAKRSKGRVSLKDRFESRVALLKAYPGIEKEVLDYYVSNYRGIVIEGTGLGHVPEHLFEPLTRAKKLRIPVVMTTQTIYGRLDMKVYSTGRHLLNLGVISGGDMIPETALVKLMWALGQTKEPGEVKRIIESNLAGELSDISRPDVFLR